MSDDFIGRPLFGSSPTEARRSVPGVVPASPTFGSRVAGGLGTAARFVGGAFEPLLLPQDAMFALLAGARDENRTPVDYWRDVEWAKYAPFGATPERAATGSDLLRLYGIQNSNAQRWGGIALDLVADPLLVGSWVWGVGKALKPFGVGDELITLGRNIDDNLSLIPITRGDKRRSLFHSTIPQAVRDNIVDTTERAVSSLLDMPFVRGASETIAPLLPRRGQLQMRFGREAGRELQEQESLARSMGGEIREEMTARFEELNDILGFDTGNWFGNILESIGLRSRAASKVTKFRTATQSTILRQAQRLSDNHGVLLFNSYSDDIAGLTLGARTQAGVEFRTNIAGLQPSSGQRAQAAVDMETALQRVRRTAQRAGDDIQEAEEAFRATVGIVSESDALVGYHLSMYSPIRKAFAEAVGDRLAGVRDRGSYAAAAWTEVVNRGIRGEAINELTEVGGMRVSDLLGVDTLGEFLDTNQFFSRVSLQDFVNSLGEGHMRRTYGVFMGESGMSRYMDGIDPDKGPIKLIPSTVVDETQIEATLGNLGFGRAGTLVREFFEDVKPINLPGAGPRAAAMGTVVPTEQLARHLLENGLSLPDAQRAMDALIGQISGSEAYANFVRKARSAITQYRNVNSLRQFQNIEGTGPGARGVSTAVQERATMEEEYLEILGEIANPLISLDEASRLAERSMPTDVYLRNLYEFAEQNGLVSSEYRSGMSPLGIREADAPAVFAFAGKYVHPLIEKEIKRAVRRPEFRTPQWLERISQFIRGSLLAGPNILTANLGGGIYTSSLLGLNPIQMTSELMGVLQDAARAARDPDFIFEDYQRLRELIPLDLSRMSDAAFVERGARRLAREYAGESQRGPQQTLEAIGDLLRTFVDNPAEGVIGAAGRTQSTAGRYARRAGAVFGLQGFAASEAVMKIAAYRTAMKQGFNMHEAAEIARLSTFDYSELPDILRTFRDNGLLMFPGFSYFIAGRTLTGALRRPGVTAAWNRVPEAIMNAQDIPMEDRYALWASMPEWLKEDIGVPIRKRTGGQGEDVYSVVPINQFLPINTWTPGNLVQPFGQSIATLGLYQPFFEVMYSAITGSGEAPFSARYGQQVFEAGRSPAEQAAQAMGFLYNNIAPNALRKFASYSPGAGVGGIAGSLFEQAFIDMPADIARLGYSNATLRAGRVVRDLADNVISSVFRSVQPISLGGRYASVERTFNQASFEHNEKLNTLRNDYISARAAGDTAKMARIRAEVQALNEEFRAKWRPLLDAALQR